MSDTTDHVAAIREIVRAGAMPIAGRDDGWCAVRREDFTSITHHTDALAAALAEANARAEEWQAAFDELADIYVTAPSALRAVRLHTVTDLRHGVEAAMSTDLDAALAEANARVERLRTLYRATPLDMQRSSGGGCDDFWDAYYACRDNGDLDEREEGA